MQGKATQQAKVQRHTEDTAAVELVPRAVKLHHADLHATKTPARGEKGVLRVPVRRVDVAAVPRHHLLRLAGRKVPHLLATWQQPHSCNQEQSAWRAPAFHITSKAAALEALQSRAGRAQNLDDPSIAVQGRG